MSYSKDFFRTLKLLSQRVAQINEFLPMTACLGKEEREFLGVCHAYKTLYGEEDQEFTKDLDKIMEAIRQIGHSNWDRTELTDLGLMLADKDIAKLSLKELLDQIDEEK